MKLRQQQSGARLCAKHQPQHALLFQCRTNKSPAAAGSATTAALRGFTLVELIAVMALLVVVIAMASPSLAGFFRGRAVEAEARRMLSLSRLGQSRAAAEGIPMILWVDLSQRTYGLEADSSFVDEDPRAIEYTVDGIVTMEIGATDDTGGAITANTLFGSGTSNSKHASLPNIRFEPDGGISASSPESFQLLDRDNGSLWVGLTANRLSYEVRNQATQRVTARARR